MRYVGIDQLSVGMKLAKPIYDASSRVLLGANTILNKEYIRKLVERGLGGLYIEDEISDDIDIQEVITEELRNEGVRALKSGDIDLTMKVAKDIVGQILDQSSVTLELVDLRTFDDYTFRHSVNVAVLATVIGINMELNRYDLEELCIAAILHDIGKLMVNPVIINKPGKLTDQEYEEVKKHPEYAYDILRDRFDISSRVRASILAHHENEDGSGYPHGYHSNQIYIFAKIIHVADVFDALTARRPYKEAYARAEAVEYLMGSCDRLFNREVVTAFLQSVPVYPKGTTVLLSDQREALVIGNTKNVLRPVVRFVDGSELDLGNLSVNRNITIVGDHIKEEAC